MERGGARYRKSGLPTYSRLAGTTAPAPYPFGGLHTCTQSPTAAPTTARRAIGNAALAPSVPSHGRKIPKGANLPSPISPVPQHSSGGHRLRQHRNWRNRSVLLFDFALRQVTQEHLHEDCTPARGACRGGVLQRAGLLADLAPCEDGARREIVRDREGIFHVSRQRHSAAHA